MLHSIDLSSYEISLHMTSRQYEQWLYLKVSQKASQLCRLIWPHPQLDRHIMASPSSPGGLLSHKLISYSTVPAGGLPDGRLDKTGATEFTSMTRRLPLSKSLFFCGEPRVAAVSSAIAVIAKWQE